MTPEEKIINYLTTLHLPAVDTAVILGTGLHRLLENLIDPVTIPFHTIPGFPVSTVGFHKGNLVFGYLSNRPVVILEGRFHAYEGYCRDEIVLPVRVLNRMGVKNLFISNAAGGINPSLKKGNLTLVKDHLNFQQTIIPVTGLTGWANRNQGGFYSTHLQQVLLETAAKNSIELKSGIYAAVTGPNLETPAEYRFLRHAGADLVGMSTVPEVMEAKILGISCAVVSVITDECDPDDLKPVNIEEIISVAGAADVQLSRLFHQTIAAL